MRTLNSWYSMYRSALGERSKIHVRVIKGYLIIL